MRTYLISFGLIIITVCSALKVSGQECPKPADDLFEKMCECMDFKDIKYKDVIMKMACIDKNVDTRVTANVKIQSLWNKYRKDFYCNGEGFRVKNGNILKYSVYQNFPVFVEGMVRIFNVDINFKDPADGKTLLDYVQDEIQAYKKSVDSKDKVQELEFTYRKFRTEFNAKHASEL